MILATEEFTKKFKDLTKKNRALATEIHKKITELSKKPDLGKPLSYDLSGKRSLRVGKYRIIYELKGENIILLTIEHRKKVY